MMHLEAIKERNRKPARQPEVIETSRYAGEARLANSPQHTAAWRVSPMASIDAAPLPEYMQGR